MEEFIIVYMTAEKKEDAESISKKLVEDRLVACAQVVGPIRSIYWWKGDVEDSPEWLAILKTKSGLFERLIKRIKELHPYEVPEIVGVPITHGSEDYLNWLKDEVLK